MQLTRSQKWLFGFAFCGVVIATLYATGLHVRIEFYHQTTPTAERQGDVGAILDGMAKVAFLDGAERSGGIISRDHLDMSPRSGGVVGDRRDGYFGGGDTGGHGASGSWGGQTTETTERWGMHIELGWDRGPRGSVGADFSHESKSKSNGGGDHDHNR